MIHVLLGINDNDKEVFDSLKKDHKISKGAAVRTFLALIRGMSEDITLIAVDKENISIVKGYGGGVVKTSSGNVSEVKVALTYDENKGIVENRIGYSEIF